MIIHDVVVVEAVSALIVSKYVVLYAADKGLCGQNVLLVVLQKYSTLRLKFKIGILAVKLAREAILMMTY